MNILNELTIQQFVTRLVMMVLVMMLHGSLIALMAKILADRRPEREGHLSLSLVANLAYSGLTMAVLFGRGWTRPIRLTPASDGRSGLRIMALILLGCLLPLLLIPLLDLLRSPLQQYLSRTTGYTALYSLQVLQELTIGTMLMSLIPVPGMLAGNLWRIIRPQADKKLIRLEPIGLALMMLLLVLGWLPDTAPLLNALRLV